MRPVLEPKVVLQIRALYAEGFVSQEELGRRFGVAQATISSVVRGVNWKGVGGNTPTRGTRKRCPSGCECERHKGCPPGCVCKRHGRPRLARTITKDGYVVLYRPEHPLANKGGLVLEHRQVLYDQLGPGPHSCYWLGVNQCGFDALSWKEIHVDHLDENRSNNDPLNLVPSCPRCNMNRHRDALLKPGDVRVIKDLYEAGRLTQDAVGTLFGVSGATIGRLINNRLKWSVVKGGDADEKTA